MNRNILILLFSLLSLSVSAQSDTSILYTDFNYNIVDASKADLIYKVYRKDSASWILSTFNKKNIILTKETYSDSLLSYRNGQYMEYKNGKPCYKGMYIQGMKYGNFLSFDSVGRVSEIKAYQNDSLNGPTSTYWASGAKLSEGNYLKGKKIGDWITLYENGNLAIKEFYSPDGEILKSTYLTIDSMATTREKIESPAIFPGGMEKFYLFLAKNVKYPPAAAEANIQGNVFISFTINEMGKLEDVKIDRKLHPSIDSEALRVVRLSPNWIPAVFMGLPKVTKVHIPIRFNLN
ncbi:MAG: TonB family protein [Pedobacter sp.]|nr:MAG: TonB family protein [Pedobacter sp.]